MIRKSGNRFSEKILLKHKDNARAARSSEGEKHRSVPGELIGLVSVLNSAPDIAEQMVGVADVVASADPDACRGKRSAAVGGLVKQLDAKLQFWEQLIGNDAARQAKILRRAAADHATSAAEGRPSSVPVLLHPHRQQQRRGVVTDILGRARQKHPRKYADVKTKGVLVQEAVFCGQFDIARAEARTACCGTVEAHGHRGGQLQVRRRAIVEVDPRRATNVTSRGGAATEG